jgi:hypothetical protein
VSNYDVVVIGAGLPGLGAAVLLAKANRRVLILEPSERPGGILAAYDLAHLRFAAGPVITQGYEPGGPLRLLHASIGLPVYQPHGNIAYQVALPDRRITFFADTAGTMEEFRREFPGEIDRITAVYRDLQTQADRQARSTVASVIARRRSAERFLQAHRVGPELRTCFDVQARFFFGEELRTLSLADLTHMVVTAPMQLQDGFHGLASRLRDHFTSIGGEYRSGEAWPELQFTSRRRPAIITSAATLQPEAMIINASWEADRTVFLGVHDTVMPVSMSHTVIALSSYDRPDEIIVLTVPPAQKQEDGPASIRTLTATCLSRADREATREQVLARIRPIMPFLDEHIAVHGVRDPAARVFPFPASLAPAVNDAGNGSPLKALRPAKNLFFLQDRTNAVNRSIAAAQKAAAALT